MLVNQLIHVTEDYDSGAVTEPVTVQQLKNYLRAEGFVDESGEHEFDFDDDLMADMIEEGRQWVEKYTGQFIVPRSLTVVLLNQAGNYRLPGPMLTGITSLKDYNGTEITTEYTVIGDKLITSFCDRVTATYEVGMETPQAWVKNAILAYCAWAYIHRGDEADVQQTSPSRAASIARPHRRTPLWG